MSKSLNNFFLVKDILEQYSADALRFFLLSTHYRSPLDFSDERLDEATKAIERFQTVINNLLYLESRPAGSCETEASELLKNARNYLEEFEAAMSDDFNTALATAPIYGLAKEINIYYQSVQGCDGTVCHSTIGEVKEIFKLMLDILGLLEDGWKGQESSTEEYNQLMEVILNIRQCAREQKQWGIADSIRDELANIGIVIEDSPQGARWKKREL